MRAYLPVTDGLVHELGRDGRVDSSTDGTNDLPSGADELPDPGNLLVDERVLSQARVSVSSAHLRRSEDVPWSTPSCTRRC
jgi:hypothetical protein